MDYGMALEQIMQTIEYAQQRYDDAVSDVIENTQRIAEDPWDETGSEEDAKRAAKLFQEQIAFWQGIRARGFELGLFRDEEQGAEE